MSKKGEKTQDFNENRGFEIIGKFLLLCRKAL